MTPRPLILVAASGLAREALSAIDAGGDRVVEAILDDDAALHGTSVGGIPVLGPVPRAKGYRDAEFVVCAGKGSSRSSIVSALAAQGVSRDRFASIIDPTVRIPASCTVGVGAILLANTVLTADVTLGDHVVTMPGAVITHNCVLEDFATLCAGVTLGGAVCVGQRAYLGTNSSVRQGVRVGSDSVLGMGAALLTDLPDAECWAGVPAERLR
ncbi:NeuD/PglB/VioB family sugar acetyltransferase [Gordonia rhizosphera]|uniref:Putative acetyltransferase n=1 Tax=Gordonia rhizosphera NBRC 16068 TaxID=1108045 RepID=K6W5W8_9ACTN|nr:NeuD/PglB/VioB family sugar acetyltransferase [Gordonia rhizosphera]GAB89096.1 putative acetyltransferase [Gordonia rhizosphera NBRC 16068]